MAKAKGRPAPVVAVLNMKGGVGKTVLSGNVFREVFEHRKLRTLLVDFDAQFNLSQLLLTEPEYTQLRAQNKTIYHVLEPPPHDSVFAVSDDDLASIGDVDAFTEILEVHPKDASVDLRLIPGDFQLALLNIREQPALRLPKKRFQNFIRDAQSRYGLIVLDCNPSSSFITLSALEVATHVLVPVRPDKFALQGVRLLNDFLSAVPTISRNIGIQIVLNDVSEKSDQDVVSALRGHTTFGATVLVNEVRSSKFLMPEVDYSGFAVDRNAPHRTKIKDSLEKVADEVAQKLGL